MASDKLLVLTDRITLSLGEVVGALKDVKKENFDPMIMTQASAESLLSLEASTVDYVVFMLKSSEFPNDQLLANISRALRPGGTVSLHLTSKGNSSLQSKLLLAGFLDVQSLEANQSIVIIGKKPSWKIGSSFSLKKTPPVLPKIQIDDDMDLIDEDSLLTEEDLKKPILPSVGDCEVGITRKACKNCTCGRAEEEATVEKLGLTVEQLDNPQSACGSCGLGDAFRCGTCPYKGLPPFQLGEKVTLTGNFLAADI